MKKWRGPFQDFAQVPSPPPNFCCFSLPPGGMTLPLQSPLGLNQMTSAAAKTQDSGFFTPLSNSSLNSQAWHRGAPRLYLIN